MSPAVGCVTGLFDLFQVAHLDLIRQARTRCGRLLVVLPSDECAVQLGLQRPVVPYDERAAIVRAVAGVHDVVQLVDSDLAGLLGRIAPDLVLSHELDLPGTSATAGRLRLPVVTARRLQQSASTVLRPVA